jgi:hypothetical protein
MIVRDRARLSSERIWLPWIEKHIDLNTGNFITSDSFKLWNTMVIIATKNICNTINITQDDIDQKCALLNCCKYCKTGDKYCSKIHAKKAKKNKTKIS